MRMFPEIEKLPKDFGEKFLLLFIKEVIENTSAYHELKIREEVKKVIKEKPEKRMAEEAVAAKEIKKAEIKNIIHEKEQRDSEKLSEMYIKGLPLELKNLSEPTPLKFRIKKTPVLRIPETALPPTVSHIMPVPTAEEIDIGKLNALVRDPIVRVMECNGPDENIFVMGIMGRKPTPIKLSKEEMQEILERFSSATKIPITEGLFKAAIGTLVLSAVISEIAGIKFIIRKISPEFQRF